MSSDSDHVLISTTNTPTLHPCSIGEDLYKINERIDCERACREAAVADVGSELHAFIGGRSQRDDSFHSQLLGEVATLRGKLSAEVAERVQVRAVSSTPFLPAPPDPCFLTPWPSRRKMRPSCMRSTSTHARCRRVCALSGPRDRHAHTTLVDELHHVWRPSLQLSKEWTRE